MTLPGKIHNGVVVFNDPANLPEGTPVTVVVEQPPTRETARDDRMSAEERARVIGIIKQIASLPNENPGDTFSGVDHDQALYGEP
jgi:hypothetical protein